MQPDPTIMLDLIGLRPIIVDDLRHEAVLLPRLGLLLLDAATEHAQREAAIERAIAAAVDYLPG